jgi:hypothetical protein
MQVITADDEIFPDITSVSTSHRYGINFTTIGKRLRIMGDFQSTNNAPINKAIRAWIDFGNNHFISKSS